MDVKVKATKEFIPTFRDNKKLAPGDQIIVGMRLLTVEERDDCYVDTPNGGLRPDRKLFFSKGVEWVKNLKENGKKVESAEGILEAKGLFTLFLELATEAIVMNIVTEEEEKNS